MLELKTLSKIHRTAEIETLALNEVSLSVTQGEFVAIMGPSGCGKSTLLHLLGLLDAPTSGTYRLLDSDVTTMSEGKRTQLRKSAIGFIFQSFNLIEDLSVEENVEVSLIYRGVSARQRRLRVQEALKTVGVEHRARHFPSQLSGGQQQRVAIARALVSTPRLILADEPTGNLDSANGAAVLALLASAVSTGATVIMVTHSLADAAVAHRQVNMLDGRVISESRLGN